MRRNGLISTCTLHHRPAAPCTARGRWWSFTPVAGFWLVLVGILLLPAPSSATPQLDASQSIEKQPVAVVSLRMLLDTAVLGPAATYQQLGLLTGAAVQSFYTQRNFTPIWTHPDSGWTRTATQALALLRRAPEFGLNPQVYSWEQLLALPDSLRRAASAAATGSLENFELRLTDALLRYATHLRYGQLQPFSTVAAAEGGPAAQQSVGLLQTALAAPDFAAAFLRCQPTSQAYRHLQQAWRHTLPPDSLQPDSLGPPQGNAADFRRVALNLERLRWDVARPDTGDYALVNIASYTLHIINKGRVVQSHRVVVGKPETPTPTLDSRIKVFMTSPDWRVPYSIAVGEMLPEIQDDPSFLADNNYHLFDYRNRPVNPWHVRWSRVTPETFPYTIRQSAGRSNALGNIVFYFANQHAIYLHDTQARTLFREPRRARSHGCIRVEKPLDLAAYLLRRENQQAALPDIRRSIATRSKCRYDLAQGLPIRIRYTTCEAQNGKLRFYPDIYCLDEALATALALP